MLDSEEFKDKYGAIIKVVSYLSDYHKSKRKEVIARIKKTKKYKEDEYFREWID